jgi:DNA-binding GntR family transcriptional regulator
MPAREALGALTVEGLLEGLPHRGYRVVNLTRQDIEDVFTVQAFVAGILAGRAAEVIDDASLQVLRDLQLEGEIEVGRPSAASEKAERIEDINYRFHRTINLSPEAGRLRWFLRATARYSPPRYFETTPRWADATIKDHPEIIEALAERAPGRARELMESHVRRAGELVIQQLAQAGFWDELEEASLV